MTRALTFLASLIVAIGLFGGSAAFSQSQATPENLTIAFIGDQGLGPNAEAVLQLIRSEGAQAVIHSGDFDYADNPAAWEAQIDAVLGDYRGRPWDERAEVWIILARRR